jgi:hypothetical protein
VRLYNILVYCGDGSTRPKEVVQNGDLICLKDLNATSLTIGLGQDFYVGEAIIKNIFTSETLTNKLKSKKVMTSIIVSSNKLRTIYINSFLKIVGQFKYESSRKATSFIQLGHENYYLNNVKQWKLLGDYDLSNLNKKLNTFINSHLIVENSIKNIKISKEIEIVENFNITSATLTNSEHILIEANFKFVNYLWNNNAAYIKAGEEVYWLDNHNWDHDNQCDAEKWNNHIRIILPSRKVINNQISLTFGLKLNDRFEKLNINQCHEIIKILNQFDSVEFFDLNVSIK